MTVLVTGAAGHVGGAIRSHLKDAGHHVVGLGRRCNTDPSAGGVVLDDVSEPGLAGRMAALLEPCTAIVHAAALITDDLFDGGVSLANCFGTQQTLELASRWGVESFVFVSSIQVIGVPRRLPVDEEHPVDPPTAYHASKLFGERIVTLAGGERMRSVILRLTSPIGPGLKGNRIVPSFIRQCLTGAPLRLSGQGGRRQDYVDVRDIARAVESSLRSEARGVFHVASGQAISNLDLALLCKKVLGSPSPIEFTGLPDPHEEIHWQVSIDKARRLLGHEPRYPLENSLRALAAEYAHSTD